MTTQTDTASAKDFSSAMVPIDEDTAIGLMWHYYRDNKSLLDADVRYHRETILQQLTQGISPQQVFAAFLLTPDVAKKTAQTKPGS
jgi:hypothetical protein